ncbi:MAG: GntR family transcriptional regulator [Anaerolineae bacterium]
MSTDADKAYQTIKEKIITLELPPGSAIHETALAEELRLGRTPIREALKLLQAEQLVTTVPRRGMFVSSISITDLQQIAEVRVQLEGLAARLAAQRATAEELAALEEACRQAAEASTRPAHEAIHIDRKLHSLIASAAHNEYLKTEVERFYSLSLRLWYVALTRVRTQDLDIQMHFQVLDAIRSRDAQHAEALMQEHIHNFHKAIRALL